MSNICPACSRYPRNDHVSFHLAVEGWEEEAHQPRIKRAVAIGRAVILNIVEQSVGDLEDGLVRNILVGPCALAVSKLCDGSWTQALTVCQT